MPAQICVSRWKCWPHRRLQKLFLWIFSSAIWRGSDLAGRTRFFFFKTFTCLYNRENILAWKIKNIHMLIPFSKILFTQYTCASLWWQLVLNTANLWMQLTLKAAVAAHVWDVFTGWLTPSTGLARVLLIICQKSHNLVRLSDEYTCILCYDLEFWPWPWKSNQIQYKGALLPPWINFNPSMDK